MSNPDVTVFFRDISKWKSPSPYEHPKDEHPKDPELSETISDRDITNLYDISMCILNIRKRAKDENRKTIYDNPTLEEFMDEFTIMIDEISRKKNIKDFIAHRPTPSFEISAPVRYD